MNTNYQPPLAQSPDPFDFLSRRLILATRDVFTVREIGWQDGGGDLGTLANAAPGRLELRGRLLVAPEEAYSVVAERFRALGHIAVFNRDGDDDVIAAIPGALPTAPTRYWLSAVLFLLTLVSVLWTGAQYADEPSPLALLSGWPFAASLLGILLAHELGHFVVARRLGVPASPPFFIPFPLSLLGTLGAVIRMTAPPRDRRALLAVAAAGPLAGLVVAIPVLLIGLSLSEVQPIPATGPILQEGNSILYATLKYLLFGRLLPDGELDVFLHPVALAGWAGLLVTGLNLIPAGQLDGGHIAYALLGARARWLTAGVVVVLLVLSTQWEGWLLWAALVFFIGRRHAVPLNDLTPLRRRERALVLIVALVFLLVFTPIPLVIRP